MLYRTLKNLLLVESEVPFDGFLSGWLYVNQVDLQQVIRNSRRFEAPYLAWETVRTLRNPFFDNGSGFEGYFIGEYTYPETVLDELLHIGHDILDSNARIYPHNTPFLHRLMDTLAHERSDPAALAVWSDVLGATLARLRGGVHAAANAAGFQSETYRLVSYFPKIKYLYADHSLFQNYAVGFSRLAGPSRPRIDLNALKPRDYDAGLVM